VSGLDQALWDIAGKVRGAPVHELLGGPVRDKVRIYGWIGGDDPAEIADHAAAQVDAGLTAIKMNAGAYLSPVVTQEEITAVAERAQAARGALGPGRDFAVDFHGRVTRPSAPRLIEALEPSAPMFVEEPLVPEQSHLFGGLVERTSIPIATGERLYSRQEFLPVLQQGVTVLQPDLCHAGGISEVRRIAALAETFGALLAPHCPLGPIALAASLQIDFATPNFLIQEQSLGIHYNEGSDLLDYLVDKSVFGFENGYVRRPTGPGLGIEVDETEVARAAKSGHDWRTPTFRRDDGSLAEW
jgi:galactonate dehydratase